MKLHSQSGEFRGNRRNPRGTGKEEQLRLNGIPSPIKTSVIGFLLLCFIFVLLFMTSWAREESLYVYQGSGQFYSPRNNHKPYINIYAYNQDFIDIKVFKIEQFSLKNGAFYYDEKAKPTGPQVYSYRTEPGYYDRNGRDISNSKKGVSGRVYQGYQKDDIMEMNVNLPVTETGVYRVIVQGKSKTWSHVFVISPVGMIVKQGDDFVEGFIYDQKADKPVSQAVIKLYDKRGYRNKILSDESGVFRFQLGKELRGQITLLSDTSSGYALYSFEKEDRNYNRFVYVYTERPVYRPGDQVFFKGLAGDLQKDKTFALIKNKKIKVRVKDPQSKLIYEQELKSDDFGSFEGDLKISGEAPLGDFSIITAIDGENYYQTFSVQEYKKPEFEVFVTPDKDVTVRGDEVKIDVKAIYYFGNPVKEGKVHYEITAGNDYLRIPGIYKYYYGGSTYTLAEGDLELDQEGMASFVFKTSSDQKQDKIYKVRCSVRDKSNRIIQGNGSFSVRASAIRVMIHNNKYVQYDDQPVDFSVYTRDIYDREISSPVTVNFFSREWNGKESKYDYKLLTSKKINTDERGFYSGKIKIDKPPYYVYMEALTEDEKGNKNSDSDYAWIMNRREDPGYYSYNYPSLEIIKDQQEYKPGDTAKILINSNYKDIYLYATLEQDKIYQRWVIPAKGNSTLLEIPITKEYSPGVYFHVGFVKKGNYQAGKVLLRVPDEDQKLKVEIISDKEVYSPGERVDFEIHTTDKDHNPVPALVCLGVVDDAVYAIQPDSTTDIFDFFYGPRSDFIQTRYSVPEEFQGGSYQNIPKKQKEVPPMKYVRKNFKDTTYWNPRIITDKKGIAHISFTLADNLTRWRTTARGISGDVQVGQILHKVVARKELTIRLGVPRFFRYKDQIWISSVVSNDSKKEQEITVRMEAHGAKIKDGVYDQTAGKWTKETLYTFKPGEEKSFDYPLILDSYPQDGKVTLYAHAKAKSGLFDGMEQSFPVDPFGKYTESFKIYMNQDKIEESIKLPDEIIKNASEVKLLISPSIAGNILGTFDYLAQYPYGCVEQTMSRFLPNCILKKTLADLGIKNERIEKELPLMVKKGLERLYDYQHTDGGWGWWKDDETNPYMTAYVLFGFYQAEQTGYTVDKNVVRNGLLCLKNRFKTEKNINIKSFILYTLSLYNSIDKKDTHSLYEEREKLCNYSLALLFHSLNKIGEKEKADMTLTLLDSRAKKEEGFTHWEGDKQYGWMSDEVESTAWVLSAYMEGRPESPVIPETVVWLLSRKTGDHWVTTKTTAYVVMSLSSYVLKTGETDADYTCRVYANQRMIKELQFDKNSVYKEEEALRIPLSSPQLNIRIEKEGKGKLYVSKTFKAYSDEKPDPGPGNNFKVMRKYLIKGKDGKWEPVNRPVKVGETIMVSLDITPMNHYRYVMIEDPLPSGFEIKDENRPSYRWWYYMEKRDNRVVFFHTYMYNYKYEHQYYIQPERPGRLNIMPTTISPMYLPYIKDSGEIYQIEVVE